MGIRKSDKHQLLTWTCTNQTTSWLVHNLSTFGARKSHRQTQTHKTHHGPDLGKPPLPLYSIFCASPRGPHLNGILSLRLWGPITLCANLQLRWSLKQSYSPCWELFNGMWHATWTQGIRVNSWLLVIKSQTANLTPGLSFGHNLYFKCSNESCEPILDIYVWIAFQWYKGILNPLGFHPYNYLLKIWESTGTLTLKMGVHLEVWRFFPSHSFALPRAWNATPGLSLGPHPYKPLL
jgi:hypothetical protein